jgi:nucleoside-diphosphate-sugar epimerase
MALTALSDPAIPIGSTILVTAANSLIGSHVVDQLLAVGYHVRGTVRTPSKCGWMEPLYARRHDPGRFELIQVVDFDSPGAWDAAVRGVAGIGHVAAGVDLFVQDFEAAVRDELKIRIPLLEAAKKEPSVKSFAYTSSAWAAWTLDAGRRQTLTEWT